MPLGCISFGHPVIVENPWDLWPGDTVVSLDYTTWQLREPEHLHCSFIIQLTPLTSQEEQVSITQHQSNVII